MKKPQYIFILEFIVSKNSFLTLEEIVINQSQKTARSDGQIKLYVYTALKRLKQRDQIASIVFGETAITFWGLPSWTDNLGYPLAIHKPSKILSRRPDNLYGVNPTGKERNSFKKT